jgi:hypothetical protein
MQTGTTATDPISALNMNKALAATTLDQIGAKQYLQSKVFPKLEVALNSVSLHFALKRHWLLQLLETIEKNGEFEKYVDMLDEREEKERRDLRRRERERKRLELGDHYVSDNDSEEDLFDDSENSDSDEEASESVSDPE